MSYITVPELAEGAGMLQELAEPFGVAVDLMAATIADGDRSAWTSDEIEDADNALAAIQNTLTRAAAEMNPFLVKRGYPLPLSSSDFPVLKTWQRSIFRYHHQPQRDRTNEETGRIERDYRATLQTLRAVGNGEQPIGENDPVFEVAGSAGSPDYTCEPRVFSRDTLGGF